MEHAAPMTQDAQQRFQELLERHRGIVVKVAGSYAWHAEDRADLAQEIAAQLWRAFPRYDAARAFSTWMYRIALNVAISFARDHGLEVESIRAFDLFGMTHHLEAVAILHPVH